MRRLGSTEIGHPVAGPAEQVFDDRAGGLQCEGEGSGVHRHRGARGWEGSVDDRREGVVGPTPVGGALGVELVAGRAVGVESGDGQGGGVVDDDRGGQVDAGGFQFGPAQRAQRPAGQPRGESGGGAQPRQGDGGVRRAAAGVHGQMGDAVDDSVGWEDGVGDDLADHGDGGGHVNPFISDPLLGGIVGSATSWFEMGGWRPVHPVTTKVNLGCWACPGYRIDLTPRSDARSLSESPPQMP